MQTIELAGGMQNAILRYSRLKICATGAACLPWALWLTATCSLLPAAKGEVQVETVASFSHTNGVDPRGGLIQDTDGSFYGTTVAGGKYDEGTVFRLAPDGNLSALVSFDRTNGAAPFCRLLKAQDGFLYGTTWAGGVSNYGTVFRITPGGPLNTLVSFTGTNGSWPVAGLIQTKDGALYGTTEFGGEFNSGTVFRLRPDLSIDLVTSDPGNSLGTDVVAGLVEGSDGNLYGATRPGYGARSIFKVATGGELTPVAELGNDIWGEVIADLVQGFDGWFYGTVATHLGGAVFRVDAVGDLDLLATFSGTNGANPSAALLPLADGSFLGTTTLGGAHDSGTIFQVLRDGTLRALYSFSEAASPRAPLMLAADGYFYGETSAGGTYNYGGIFRFWLTVPSVLHTRTGSDGTLSVTWNTQPSKTYQLQYSVDLSSWQNSGGPILATGFSVTASVPIGPGPQRFYRVLMPQ